MVIFQQYDPANGFNPFMLTGGTPIPTTDPSGNDTFFNFNINGPGMTSVLSYPSAAGDIPITVTPASVPEPGSGVLMLLSVACTGTAVGWRRSRARRGASLKFSQSNWNEMRYTMNRSLLLALLGLFLTFGPAALGMGGTITYDLNNYASLQNGYTLSGSITTDGTIGTLPSSVDNPLSSHIVAWSFSVTGPQALAANSQDQSFAINLFGVIATATSLIIPPPPQGQAFANSLQFIDEGDHAELVYAREGDDAGTSADTDFYGFGFPLPPGSIIPDIGWMDTALRPPGLDLGSVGISAQGGPSDWSVGTLAVPEPGTLTLALLGIACLAVAQATMRYRAAGRQPARLDSGRVSFRPARP
jgi:hypothetical protein